MFINPPSSDVLEKIKSQPICLDGGGKELVDSEILKIENLIILEVGVFFGGSAERWLSLSSRIQMIGIDLFGEGWEKIIQRYQDEDLPWMRKVLSKVDDVETLKESLRVHGASSCCIANLSRFGNRFKVVKSDFEKLASKLRMLCTPDIVYLDADKSYELLNTAYQYFPNAVLCGDDWTWGKDQGFPMQ